MTLALFADAPFIIPEGARIAITANRNITFSDATTIAVTMRDLRLSQPSEIIFGGARGGDTVALGWAATVRKMVGASYRLVVIVPSDVFAQPYSARVAIRRDADEVIELGLPITREDGWSAYHKRNEAVVDRATHVVAFSDGDNRSGTASCMAYARSIGRPVRVVSIVGGDK